MNYGSVPGITKPLSRVVLGTMGLGKARESAAMAVLDAAFAAGINTFDTARIYGSEGCLGKWADARGLRDQVVIVTKGCHPRKGRSRVTPEDLDADLVQSLADLRCDCVDLFLLHRDDPTVPVGEIVAALNAHFLAGRIRAFGGSNWTHDRIGAANDYAAAHGLGPFAASSPHHSLAEQFDDPWGAGCVSISGRSGAPAREWYRKTGMAVLAYSSLGHGLFSDRMDRAAFRRVADKACLRAYCHESNFHRLDRARDMARRKGVSTARVALAFLLNQPMNVFAIAGARTPAQCADCAAAAGLALSPEDAAWLDMGAGETVRTPIPC